MNDQKRGVAHPWAAWQAVFLQPAAPPSRETRRYIGRGATVFALLSLFLVVASVLVTWSSAAPVAPRGAHPVPPAHAWPQVPPPAPPVQTTPDLQPADMAARVDRLLSSQVAQRHFSGSVLVAQDGQVLLSKGYGLADWNDHLSNTPDTRFYLGSVTKQFTALAVLLLQERGKLQVRQLLCSYISPCPAPWKSVTIHGVLTHTSGIPQLADAQLSGVSPAAWINSFDDVPLEFPAGSQEDYCSVCYQVLAYLVQQVSGEPYSQFVQQTIFDPLHMRETGFDSQAYYAHPDHAIGYASWQVQAVQLGWGDIAPQWSFLFGSGLLYSTVEDLYRWDQALYTNALIPQQVLDEAFTPYVPSNLFPTSHYGYGWFLTQSPPGHRLIWHDGVIDGFRTYIGRYVDDRVTIILLSNLATVETLALAHSIEHLVFSHGAGVCAGTDTVAECQAPQRTESRKSMQCVLWLGEPAAEGQHPSQDP